jgi:hypothetical protein
MALIGRFVEKLLRKGSITLIAPGKPPATYGPGGGKHLTVRFTDRRVAFDILKNPRLGMGEAYMDGRVVIEDGTILDFLELVVGSHRWEELARARPGPLPDRALASSRLHLRQPDPLEEVVMVARSLHHAARQRTLTFAPFTTDRIRVLVTRSRNGFSRLTEVEAFTAVR